MGERQEKVKHGRTARSYLRIVCVIVARKTPAETGKKILLDYNNNKKKKHVYPRSTHHTFTTSNVQYDKGNENAFYGLTCNSDLKKTTLPYRLGLTSHEHCEKH